MKNKDYLDYIQDILDSILEISEFIHDMKYKEFLKDKKTINAVVRSIEVIGEAVKNLSQTIKDKYQNVPWKKMSGMRDKLIHEYFGIDLEIIWKTVKEELPLIKPLILEIFKELES
ncbi:MAG: DUF86 domain-containing protein [Armatimonadetes bacterium]|nr:DUF86 domain-containing protein [Armatimonadota bacterium]